MDLDGARFETFDDLVRLLPMRRRLDRPAVRRVSSAPVTSTRRPTTPTQLGIALQQTNILRDIREDLMLGRVYLPTEDLARFGVDLRLTDDGSLVDDGGLTALIRFSADRARGWYDDGLRLVPLLDRRSAACAWRCRGSTGGCSTPIGERPYLVRDRRLSLSGWQKAAVAARSLAGRPA